MKLDQYLSEIAAGDQEALTFLFDSVSAQLFGLQLRILKNSELAEDALQATFAEVWHRAGAHTAAHEPPPPMVWLNSLARKQALKMLHWPDTTSAIDVSIPEVNPDTWLKMAKENSDNAEEFEHLHQCFQNLNNDVQASLVGLYCEGYSLEDMSRVLKRPSEDIKSWVRLCLESMRGCFNK